MALPLIRARRALATRETTMAVLPEIVDILLLESATDRIWIALGWPAFIGVIAIFALMIWRPQLW